MRRPHSRYTMLLVRFAIEVLQTTQTVQGRMVILRLKWDATWAQHRAACGTRQSLHGTVTTPQGRHRCDAFAKGQSYILMIYNLGEVPS
ncbi:MAG: hypothetical protein ACK5OB_00825 [Pirellula sp.]